MDLSQQQSSTQTTTISKTPQTSFSEGWSLFKSSVLFIFKRPSFLVPLLITWVVFASITLYLRYYWIEPSDTIFVFAQILLFIFVISYTVCLANLTLLQLIKQIEDDKPVSFTSAFKGVLSFDAIKVIPLAIFYAITWFIILVLRAATSKRRGGSRPEPSLRDAALTLGGTDGNPLNWIGLGLSVLEKLLRMTVFLALPAICWEGKNSFSAFQEAVKIIKKHPAQFLTEYALTGTAGLIMAIPLIPIIFIDKMNIAIPEYMWLLVIIYEGFIWTLGVYLEQMTTALLYLWHLKWKNGGESGYLSEFLIPDLLADFHNLRSSQV